MDRFFRSGPTFRFRLVALTLMLVGASTALGPFCWSQEEAADNQPVSFASDVRPILASRCFGCHQGAIARGDYIMTDFQRLVAGGESGDAAVVPGNPKQSRLVDVITVHNGTAEMPPDEEPLTPEQVNLIETWIAEGAKNDLASTTPAYDLSNPPRYQRQPLVTSLDVSPDGKLIAVPGFHEVLLLQPPTAGSANPTNAEPRQAKLVGRLIGISSRIESVEFSPDGSRLAVAGGSPAEFGELQVWDVATQKLELSRTVSFDTLHGVSWSPDGKLISFGCTDSTLRAIDAETGEQVLFQGAHDDWVRDTVFSVDGKQLVSVGRDMSCKLTDVPTERFIDNITSITPGVLKGGIAAVDRHPARDEVIIGGADGTPKLYRMNRLTKRVIGDDANLIRRFPKMEGRINAVSISADGKRFAAVSSLDGKGYAAVYSLEFDTKQPDEIRAIVSKQVSRQTPAEKAKLESYVTGDAKKIVSVDLPDSPLYACQISDDGKTLVVGGNDGLLRTIDCESGNLIETLMPVSIDKAELASVKQHWRFPEANGAAEVPSIDLAGRAIKNLRVFPEQIAFTRPADYAQLIVQAQLDDGSTFDVTNQAQIEPSDGSLISVRGSLVEPLKSGKGSLRIEFGGASAMVSVDSAIQADFQPDFIRDVNPVLTKLGCNAGTCHGSQGGKKGFKLSLRGYDPLYDIRAFTDELGSRRVNPMVPDQSLMLLKPSTMVAHEGGQLITKGDKYYSLIQKWIASGAKLNLDVPRVVAISVQPENPVLPYAGTQQPMRVVASYSDGSEADVTREAVLEIGNIEVAKVSGNTVAALRRGEAAVLARYEGAFTSTTVTVMGDRSGYAWKEPETWSPIDRFVAAKWKRLKILPSDLCSDEEFVRRVYLDLTGLPPQPAEVRAFLDDARPTREKRDALIDTLVGNEQFVEHWSNKWADLMQVNRKYLGAEGAQGLRQWLSDQVAANRPYDEFAREILTASGSNKDNPAAAYYKIHRTPEDAMENTTHLFLATRFNCNKCHDHPFERWTQDQYYETAAFFAQIGRKPDPAAKGKKIPGSAVESPKPLFEIIDDGQVGEMVHARTGKIAEPDFPFPAKFDKPSSDSRRDRLAAWVTSPDNPYFATSYVNRLWGYLLGVGLIEPLDDIRAGNPASNPELLAHLRQEFIASGFDTRHIIRMICKSRTYQLSVKTNRFNQDDRINYSHALARRLPAEVLFDSVHAVTGSELRIPGVKPGTRAAALPDSGAKLPSGFLDTLGRPARESVCECERNSDLQLGSVLALVNGPDLARAIGDPGNEIAKLVAASGDNQKLIQQLFMRVLNRAATQEEVELAVATFEQIEQDHQQLVKQKDLRQQWWVNEKPRLEAARLEAVKSTKAELDAAIKKLDPTLLDKERNQVASLAEANAKLTEYQKQALSLDQWIVKQRQLDWQPLLVEDYQSKLGREAQVRSDRSVLLKTGKPGRDVGTLVASSSQSVISAIRFEALADPSLPGGGPGLAENGNFVLTELVMEFAHPDRPDQWQPVQLTQGKADFQQQAFSPALATDGKVNGNRGWAIVPEVGKTHWMTFQLKKPIGFPEGTRLRFKLHQAFDEQHQLGCFRIAVSSYSGLVGTGLSEERLAQLAIDRKKWSPPVKKLFGDLARADDPELERLQGLVAQAQKPVAVHPEILRIRSKLMRFEQPLPVDAKLQQLEQDVTASAQQLENQRLTAAQDLTWALINSPAFLFNH